MIRKDYLLLIIGLPLLFSGNVRAEKNVNAAELKECLEADNDHASLVCFKKLANKANAPDICNAQDAILQDGANTKIATNTSSQADAKKEGDVDTLSPPNKPERPKIGFGSYETNNIMFKHTTGDDNASEINVSFRYTFPHKEWLSFFDEGILYKLPDTFFSYTNKSDFYWLGTETRPSAPVIGRYHNPALHFRCTNDHPKDDPKEVDICKKAFSKLTFDHFNIEWIDFGLEHISNGQALDLTVTNKNGTIDINQSQANRNIAIAAANNNDLASRRTMDSISRVGMTLGPTAEVQFSPKNDMFNNPIFKGNTLKVKWFIDRDHWGGQQADVYWGPYATQNVNYNNFQKVRAQWDTTICGWLCGWHLKTEWNIGTNGLSTDSWNFLLTVPKGYYLPIGFSAHRGPMNNLSDYTRSQNTLAAGLVFAY